MELVPPDVDDDLSYLGAGTAAEHFAIGWSHLRLAIRLTFSRNVPLERVASRSTSVKEETLLLEEDQVPSNGVFLPTQGWKEVWDLWVLTFILYSAVMVPYRICFSTPATDFWWWVEQFVTAVFILDVMVNFNTAYLEDERWVIDRQRIAVRYLQGWFWIDVPSSIPIELVDYFLEGDSSTLGLLRFLRLFRLLRLLRLLKVGFPAAYLILCPSRPCNHARALRVSHCVRACEAASLHVGSIPAHI